MSGILLLGSNGMLGQALKSQLTKDGFYVRCVDRSDADYCFDLLNDERLRKCIRAADPEIIINTAAIVSLEKCEGSPGDAYCINARLPGILATICEEDGRRLVHISTDHFYRGDGYKKHTEEERIILVNEYARTKYLGELLALQHAHTLVIRTNIVGFRGVGQPTFVEWAINEIKKNNEMILFDDFFTSSIHTVDFAPILSNFISREAEGIYNIASSDVTSKKDFILKLSRAIFDKEPNYRVSSVKKLSGAPRAESLGLECSKAEEYIGYRMPGIAKTIDSLATEYRRGGLNEI